MAWLIGWQGKGSAVARHGFRSRSRLDIVQASFATRLSWFHLRLPFSHRVAIVFIVIIIHVSTSQRRMNRNISFFFQFFFFRTVAVWFLFPLWKPSIFPFICSGLWIKCPKNIKEVEARNRCWITREYKIKERIPHIWAYSDEIYLNSSFHVILGSYFSDDTLLVNWCEGGSRSHGNNT